MLDIIVWQLFLKKIQKTKILPVVSQLEYYDMQGERLNENIVLVLYYYIFPHSYDLFTKYTYNIISFAKNIYVLFVH